MRHQVQKFDNALCSFGCSILQLVIAVLHFAGYLMHLAVWVCVFVNCVRYVDKTGLVCKIVFYQLEKTVITERFMMCKTAPLYMLCGVLALKTWYYTLLSVKRQS